MLFSYDLGPLRTAYRRHYLVAHLATQVELSVQLNNHLANPGYYLRTLDNIDVRDHLSSRRFLGLAVPHPGHFHRYRLSWRRVLRQPGPLGSVIQEISGLICPKPDYISKTFAL